MEPEQQKRIASKGGKAAHQSGHAHEWDSAEAAEAGRKGGLASHHDRSSFRRNTAARHQAEPTKYREDQENVELQDEAERSGESNEAETTSPEQYVEGEQREEEEQQGMGQGPSGETRRRPDESAQEGRH
jgi:general stress protein YciG